MTLAHPSWLFALALVPLLGIVALLMARLRGNRWQAFMAARLRPSLLQRGPVFARWLSLVFLLGAFALLIGALAQPQGEAGMESEKVKGRNVLFALDLSRSMRVQDVKPDRLAQGKAVIYEMMEAMPNDRMGLVGFAGQPYLFAPLTVDHGGVHETVEQLDETWIPTGGSDVVGAVKFAIDELKKTGVRNNALVLISDGEMHDGKLDEVIKEAENAGVYIFAVGVGTENGDWVPEAGMPGDKFRDNNGRTVNSKMHPEILGKLAAGTHGRFVIAGAGENIPALAQTALADLDQFELQGREKKIVVEFYQWLLGPAIFLLVLSILTATRWRPVAARTAVAAAMAGTVSTSGAAPPAPAGTERPPEETSARFHDLAERSQRPDDAFRYRLGEGAADYRGGAFRKAAEAYSRALLSDDPQVRHNAHLGTGGALFHLGWQSLGSGESYPDPAPEDLDGFDKLIRAKLKELAEKELPEGDTETESFTFFTSLIVNWTDAVRHFDSALKLQPGNADAIQNRAVTVRYLNRLEELLKEQSDSSSQQIPQNQGPGQPGQPGEEEGEEGDGQPGDGSRKPGDKRKGGDKPGDKGDNGEKENDKGSGGDKKDDKNKKGKGPKPGETPQEQAKRNLEEKQDLQKGPNGGNISRRRDFFPPEKDW